MTANDRFDRQLQDWLEAEVSTPAPVDLNEAIIGRARRSRQRPGWLVAVRRGAFGDPLGTHALRRVRPAYILAILAIVLALVAAAIAGGALRSKPIVPGRNGAIAFAIADMRSRPYNHGHVMDPDGSNDRTIGQASCPRFSRDGNALAYQVGWADTAELVVAHADGSAPIPIPSVGDPEGDLYDLSPDGTQVAWFKFLGASTSADGTGTAGRKSELWVGPVAGGPGVRIVPAAEAANEWYSFPIWSPDGRRIAFATSLAVFTADNSGSYRTKISVVDVDGSNLHQVTARPGTDGIGLSWSPDGRFLAYVGLPDASPLPSLGTGTGPPDSFWLPLDVFVIGADGSGDRNLTNSPAFDLNPSWSPDGAFLAYQTYEAGTAYGLATIPMDGSTPAGQRNLGPISDGALWSPDGTKLLWYYQTVTEQSDGSQTVSSSIGSVDPRFRQPVVTLRTVDYGIQCPPSWQRLEP
jgi:Tol biopolymer transport system component